MTEYRAAYVAALKAHGADDEIADELSSCAHLYSSAAQGLDPAEAAAELFDHRRWRAARLRDEAWEAPCNA